MNSKRTEDDREGERRASKEKKKVRDEWTRAIEGLMRGRVRMKYGRRTWRIATTRGGGEKENESEA